MNIFRPDFLQDCLDRKFGRSTIVVPEDLYTSGYADEKERRRYGRTVAERLAPLGVTVVDIPPPYLERFYDGPEPAFA
jgi:hypothetical protein